MYSIIDIETTGGNAWTDRITEVAVYVHDGKRVIREFSSLVNPQRSIPPFVVRLTGITDQMVQDAPYFHEIAKELVEVTEGTIFVGHNVQFDYGFIRQEFKNLGFHYEKKTLCTCKLSRKLLPGHPSYSLGRLCQSIGITVNGRHRAAGDAAATVQLFERILQADGYGEIDKALMPARLSSLPDCLDTEKIYSLPEKPGVYYFYDESGVVIYIGKSKNIRKRVLSHFKKKNPMARDAKIRKELADIAFQVTGSELIALLMESEEIKKHAPKYNRAQKAIKFPFGIFDTMNQAGYLTLFADRITRHHAKPIACFKNLEQALHILQKNVDQYGLCAKLCGVEKGNVSCFNHQVKKCNGACILAEPPELYNKRVENAISGFTFKHPDFLIIDKGRNHGEKSVVRVENGNYLGFGYFEPSILGNNVHTIKEVVRNYSDNPDTRYIIHSHLKSSKNIELIVF